MIKSILGATVISFLSMTSVMAAECTPPDVFRSNVAMMGKAGNFEPKIYEYTGEDAAAIRELVAKIGGKKLEEIKEFDLDMFAVHPTDPTVLVAHYKDGCLVGGGEISKDTFKIIQEFLAGV